MTFSGKNADSRTAISSQPPIVFCSHLSSPPLTGSITRGLSWSLEAVVAIHFGVVTYSIHFEQGKTKSILFGGKHKLRNAKSFNIVYNGIEIKQHSKVKYLGCILGESLSGETMALNVIDKINSRLKFLYRQNRFLALYLDFFVMHWYNSFLLCLHNLVTKSFKETKINTQATQNKCIRFCL